MTKRGVDQVMGPIARAQDAPELSDRGEGTPRPPKRALRAAHSHRPRPRTLPGHVSKRALEAMRTDTASEHQVMGDAEPKPRTWGECKERFGDAEPCPYVSCRHHLALEVGAPRRVVGADGLVQIRDPGLKVNFPHLPIEQLPETCSLRAAEQHKGMTLEEVSVHLNLTRERARQIEAIALAKMRGDFIPYSETYDDHHDDSEELN